MSSEWNNYTFNPESYMNGLSTLGYKVMRKFIHLWNSEDMGNYRANESTISFDNNISHSLHEQKKYPEYTLQAQEECSIEVVNFPPISMTQHLTQTNDDISDNILLASQVASSSNTVKNKHLDERVSTDKKSVETNDMHTFSSQISIIQNSQVQVENITNIQAIVQNENTITTSFQNGPVKKMIDKFSIFRAPPRVGKNNDLHKISTKINDFENMQDCQHQQITESIECEFRSDAKSMYNKIFKLQEPNKNSMNKTKIGSNQVSSNFSLREENDVETSNAMVTKRKYVMEIDTSDKTAGKKKYNQLKLSDMLPVKKIKATGKKTDVKSKKTSNKPRANPSLKKTLNEVELWLNQNYDHADSSLNTKDSTESVEPIAGHVISSSQDKLKTKSSSILNDTSLENDKIPLKNLNSEKSNPMNILNKNSKFVPPTKKVIDKKSINYIIEEININNIDSIRRLFSGNIPEEIVFTILFREGFCQLDKVESTNDQIYSPKALIFCASWIDGCIKYYYFNIRSMSVPEKSEKKEFIDLMMNLNTRILCFEAQDLIMLLIDLFYFERNEVCLKWVILDPKVGCFLLDPDHPPTYFENVISQLSISIDFETTSTCPKQKAAHCLSLLSKSCHAMYIQLKENNIWHVFILLETKIINILSAMELRGICIDTKTLNEMATILNDRLVDTEKKAFNITGKSFQINSPVQLRNILFDELKLDLKNNISIKETMKIGAKSTSEPVLRSLMPFHPLPALVLNYRHIYKAKVTYVDSILHQSKCGVIKTLWDQVSAATGRIVSSNPNLQAIPKQPLALELFPDSDECKSPDLLLRNAFIPRPMYTFVAADFQHIECRVFAHMTQDSVLIDYFNKDIDVFTMLASKWLNKSVDEVVPDDRNKTKSLIYALMYGAGIQKLMEILKMNLTQAQDITSKFLESFPSLRTFGDGVIKQCRSQKGIIKSISGRLRKLPNIFSSDLKLRSQAERQAINFVIQGSAADLCKTAMVATEHRLLNLSHSLDHHLLLQIHDELVWEVPDVYVDLFKDLVHEVMLHSGEFCGGLSVPLSVAITHGKSWGEMKQ